MTKRNEVQLLIEVREKIETGQDALWWRWRYLVLATESTDREAAVDDLALDCFIRLANADPTWAIETLVDRGPMGLRLAGLLAQADIDTIVNSVDAPKSQGAVLRAAICVGVGGRPGATPTEKLWQTAWALLQQVPQEDRDEDWEELALNPSAHVAYEAYRGLARSRLERETRDFWRASFLPDAFQTAARHEDWPQFEEWAVAFRSLPPALRRGHSLCTLLNIEGHRALDDGRLADVEPIMDHLLEAAADTEFLSNHEVASLPRRLADEGHFPNLTASFDKLVESRDWRKLPS